MADRKRATGGWTTKKKTDTAKKYHVKDLFRTYTRGRYGHRFPDRAYRTDFACRKNGEAFVLNARSQAARARIVFHLHQRDDREFTRIAAVRA